MIHIDINAYYHDDAKLNSTLYKWKCDSYEGEYRFAKGSHSYGLVVGSQYLISLKNVDSNSADKKSSLIVSLTQKGSFSRRARKNGNYNEELIKFDIFKLKSGLKEKEGIVQFTDKDLVHIKDSGIIL